MSERDLQKAALRGEPSYVWRAGQERRLAMIKEAAGEKLHGRILDNGCGVGSYLQRLRQPAASAHGLEFDHERAVQAAEELANIVQAAGEALPYPTASFDLILSHEVIEHVHDDRLAVAEIVRTLSPGGRLVLFVPNRGYPFETHGVYWRGKYRFGNIPFVNYLPNPLRDRLAPHVRVYTRQGLGKLFQDLPVRILERRIIFGAYDNLIARLGPIGRGLRAILQALENTPLESFGLSHFWVIEKANRTPTD